MNLTGRIKPKYNPTPTKREKAYHIWLTNLPCVCGCGGQATVVHHPLQRHPEQRWRRDHEFVTPMTAHCHNKVHAKGSDTLAADAAWLRQRGIAAGML
tara:strand:+ start:15856 stop:16149 length:294 start_codon:yes stop_codon:yes gene_type:complete